MKRQLTENQELIFEKWVLIQFQFCVNYFFFGYKTMQGRWSIFFKKRDNKCEKMEMNGGNWSDLGGRWEWTVKIDGAKMSGETGWIWNQAKQWKVRADPT